MSQELSKTDGGWIKWFCNLEDHHFFCEVDEFFITDPLNLYGLKQQFDHFEESLQMIFSPTTPNEEDLQDEQFQELYNEATELYGLIHERYIITPQGLTMMKSKYLQGRFGVCPRVLCDRQNVLPIGLSHELRTSRVKIYCPRCQDVYNPKKRMNDVDGSFFGISFPHVFLSVFSELLPQKPVQEYVPKVYGFKVHNKKGSGFQDNVRQEEVYYYSEQHIKRLAQQQVLQQQIIEAQQVDREDNNTIQKKKKVKEPQNILDELNLEEYKSNDQIRDQKHPNKQFKP